VSYTSDALGASSWLWRFQHNTLHHGNANVVGFDADIALAPFARLAPSQPWHSWYRAQHVYIWPLYGFLALKNLLVSDVATLISGRLDQQPIRHRLRPGVVVQILAGKLVHLSWALAIPLLFNPWWAVLAFYLTCSWLVGFLLAITFQLAHCVDITTMHDANVPRRGDNFVTHQLATTADIATTIPIVGPFVRWLVGGLDHQIEHHLAPRLPHTIYPLLAARFRQACHDDDITYRLHPGIWAALRSHARWLRAMSIPAPHPFAVGPKRQRDRSTRIVRAVVRLTVRGQRVPASNTTTGSSMPGMNHPGFVGGSRVPWVSRGQFA
jgi:linoleoyl-CoA desaturase